MATLTVYPDVHPETTSVDGNVNQDYGVGNGVAWATLRAAGGTYARPSDDELQIAGAKCDTAADTYDVLYRSIFLFDTREIPSDATITAATLSIYGSSKNNTWNPANIDLNIYTSAPVSVVDLAAGDFDSLGAVALCDTSITYANWSITGYNAFALNAAGLAAITKEGITKLGVRLATYDATGTVPVWAAGDVYFQIRGYSADKLTTYRPRLVITYSTVLTVSTELCTAIAPTTATGYGTIIDIGASAVTQHGHCWATTINPTTAGSKTTNGAGVAGAFTSAITGLTYAQGYYVRAYATNTEGTAYGQNVYFTSGSPSTQKIDGNIAIKGTTIRYVDYLGQERYIEGTLV